MRMYKRDRSKIIIAILIVAALILFSSGTLVHLLTEAWWFNAVNFSGVFWTLLKWRSLTWVGTFIVFALFVGGNYFFALRVTRYSTFRLLEGGNLRAYAGPLPNYIVPTLIFVLALTAAGVSVGGWETFLKYFNASDFNISDPIYEQDISFYIFRLPLYENLQNWLLALSICGLVVSVIIYVLKGCINPQRGWQHLIAREAKTHLSLLLAGIFFLIALDFWLQRYNLLYSEDGVVTGAGYTDTHAQLWAISMMSVAALALSVLFLLSVQQRSIALPVYGMGGFIIVWILLYQLYPWFQQEFIVEPNELVKEKPYIQHNIEFTRQAYRIDEVETQQYPAEAQLNRQDLQQNQATTRNIRLWDYRPLLSTYSQLQEIRLYYNFSDVDIDRYTLDGNYRQVMLSPRELSYAQVPQRARTWVNQRLKYTHGYGLVMSPVNVVTPEGLPELFIRDIPPVSEVNLEVTQPRIYYGEQTDHYIFTGMSTEEFDYPVGDDNASNRYAGVGGVPISSIWHRLAYAYDFGSIKTLISNYFTENSRILYHRRIKERVSKVAPFLRLDSNPYTSLVDGKLKWIIEGYTVSDRYPYSEPVSGINNAAAILQQNDNEQIVGGGFNYVRNSVKVVVDAYDGTMQFYVVDDSDPLLATYRKIFPNLFEPSDAVPPQIRSHFRYPFDLFEVQAQMYLSYHMSDAEVFYNQEDLWRFPTENYQGNEQLVEPYYIIMRLPEAEREEFVLILPFTPVNKDNMVAWIAARSDGEKYGEKLLYEFPKQKLVYGTSQIEARINQDTEISQQLTLWNQQGSQVIRGNLLVIPIEQSLLYVEPIYLRAEQGELPELKRVIVADNNQVVMQPSLEESLAAMFGKKQPSTAPDSETPVPSNLAQSAQEIFRKARQAAREGNWAEYGRLTQQLEQILQKLSQKANAEPKPKE